MTAVFVAIVAVSIGWRVIRMLWGAATRAAERPGLAVLARAALLEGRDPAPALWAKVDTDREAALELRRRVLNDPRVHEAHCTQLSRQPPQDAGELVSAQAALANARTELGRLETILARP